MENTFPDKSTYEEWRPIIGYEGRYEVSNMGRVRSLRTNKILMPGNNGTGYLQAYLYSKGKHSRHAVTIHRLVATMFIPNPDNLEQINHKDGNKLNNTVDNLEWCSQSQNMKHAYSTGLYDLKKCAEIMRNHWREGKISTLNQSKALKKQWDTGMRHCQWQKLSDKDKNFIVDNCVRIGRGHIDKGSMYSPKWMAAKFGISRGHVLSLIKRGKNANT